MHIFPQTPRRRTHFVFLLAALLAANLACARSIADDSSSFWSVSAGSEQGPEQATQSALQNPSWSLAPKRTPGAPLLTPTPDAPHTLPPLRTENESYQVQSGDTLGLIAKRYGVGLEQLIQANSLANPNILEVGQVLNVPPPPPQEPGPGFKIIPDSELVYGPYSALFDIPDFVTQHGGYLASYQEQVDDINQSGPVSGAEIVAAIARDYSVNPRLLLAVLEAQSSWVTNKNPKKETKNYPIGWADPERKGLYRQLAWAANNLNRGYYLWRVGGTGAWLLSDGSAVPINPTINPGTAAVQQLYALLSDQAKWEQTVSSEGLFAVYNALFGYPFDYAFEPLLPRNLRQPVLQLPIETGVVWSFTGGPHAGWGDGSAWAALDFGPPGEALGCVPNDAWVVAVADGQIIRSANGAVVQDLDGDGLEQTGWTILYMHVATQDRVAAGTFVKAGEHIGHASCEGGVSSGTHLHLARRYNGEWIPADQDIPFILDSWVSSGTGKEYDGFMRRGEKNVEAYAGNSEINMIAR